MKKKRRRKIRKPVLVLSVVLALVCTAVVCGNLYLDSLLNKVDLNTEISPEKEALAISSEAATAAKKHHVVNIALFGADNDEQDINSTSEHRSDAIKIISLDYDSKKIKITSVERDVVAWFPGDYQGYGHFNWAYWYGGPELAIQTLNYNLDLDIESYAGFSFAALEKLVDLAGGVDIYLTAAEIGQNYQPLGVSGPEGNYHLNGHQAMNYCRIRYIDNDFYRMDRQNRVIQAVADQLKHKNPKELLDIASEMLPEITTNLSAGEMKDILVGLVTFDLKDIQTSKAPAGEMNDLCTCPGLGGYLVRSYSEMVRQVHEFIYDDPDYVPSETVIENERRTYETYGPFTK